MRLAALVPSRWRFPECMRSSLPVAVSLKRLAAPRWVLSFLLGLEALRGIAKPFVFTDTALSGDFFLQIRHETSDFAILRREKRRIADSAGGSLRCCGRCARSLFGSKQRHKDVAFHTRRRLDLPLVAELAEQASHLRAPDFLVSHFAATVKNHGADFVAFAEKPNDLVLANLKIMFGGVGPELDFLERGAAAAFALLMSSLVLLVQKLAVIGDLANRRIRGGRNFHQIQAAFAGHAKRFKRLHHAKLTAVFVNHPDFASTYAFVDANTVALLPEIPICDSSPCPVRACNRKPYNLNQKRRRGGKPLPGPNALPTTPAAPFWFAIRARQAATRGRTSKYSMPDAMTDKASPGRNGAATLVGTSQAFHGDKRGHGPEW